MSKIYNAKQLKKGTLKINGKGNHSLWKGANSLTDFNSPWSDEPINKIEFKALYDSEEFFFLFKVYDAITHINPSENKNDSINNSDRVELFFRSNKNMNPYYCLEIDPTSRIMDFEAKPNKKFDFNWSWPLEDIKVKSSKGENYFTVEIAITLKSFIKLGLLKNGQIETGIYRAKYTINRNGDYEPTWITWVNPMTASPNFHIDSSFGILKLEKYFSNVI